MSEGIDYRLLKSSAECRSADEFLEKQASLSDCAEACRNVTISGGCNFFVYYGKEGKRKGWCWWEKTDNAECPEGWKDHDYDFYELIRKSLVKILFRHIVLSKCY